MTDSSPARRQLAAAHAEMTAQQIADHALILVERVELEHATSEAVAKLALDAAATANKIVALVAEVLVLHAAGRKRAARELLASISQIPPMAIDDASLVIAPLPERLFDPRRGT